MAWTRWLSKVESRKEQILIGAWWYNTCLNYENTQTIQHRISSFHWVFVDYWHRIDFTQKLAIEIVSTNSFLYAAILAEEDEIVLL